MGEKFRKKKRNSEVTRNKFSIWEQKYQTKSIDIYIFYYSTVKCHKG